MKERGPEIRVMSFNVLNARSGHHSGPWAKRKEAAAMAIWAFGPDLLGVQELQDVQAEYLCGQLREYEFISAGRNEGLLAGESVGIFYRAERFEKLKEGHFWLSRKPDVPGSRSWGAMSSRIASWVILRDRRHPGRGKPLLFISTHFDALSRWARFRSAHMVRERIAMLVGVGGPAIVTGDFNANAGRKLYEAMLGDPAGKGLVLFDSYRAVHPVKEEHEGTWHGRGIRLPGRLDWILHTRQFAVVDAYIDRNKRNGRYPSDHFPVTATLRW
jgi:endonuclease/exonuclease/phosphatase family metal-dependent hydrolase